MIHLSRIVSIRSLRLRVRLLQGGGACGFVARADVVAFELAIEGGAADAKHFSGAGLVSVDLIEDASDGGALDVFEIVG